ncbi:MAG: helix-turn-helix domain-containing protein [Burkholderiales bacterium]
MILSRSGHRLPRRPPRLRLRSAGRGGTMNFIDMRSLSGEARHARHARRLRVIGLRQAGATYVEIASQTGLSRTGVFDICKRFGTTGPGALVDGPNGRKNGHARLLLPAQESQVRSLIADGTPDRFSLAGVLWTPEGVARLIDQHLGIRLQRRTMRVYLARWGYVRHARMERSKVRAPQALQHWLDRDLPAIEARARLEDAEIQWAHEGPLTDVSGEPLLPAPSVAMLVAPGGLPGEGLVLSTVTNKGSRRWMMVHRPLDAAACIDFLRRLTRGRHHKIFLMLDRMHVPQAEVVKAWLAEHDELVEVFRLPRRGAVQVRPARSQGGLPLSSVDPADPS